MTGQPNERGRPPIYDEGRPSETEKPADAEGLAKTHTNAADITAGLRRRRAAKHRLPVQECGVHADPWPCRHYDSPASPERNADGYLATVRHLAAAGLLPAPNVPAMRIMWRRDAEQRELVRFIAERWESVA
jgi:hypothetical protein